MKPARHAVDKESPLRVKAAMVALSWALDQVEKYGAEEAAKRIAAEYARLERKRFP